MLMGLVAAAVLAQGDMVEVAGDGRARPAARHRRHRRQLRHHALHLRHHRADRRHRLRRRSRSGVFAVGEIISNLGDPEERQVFTVAGDEPLADAGGPQALGRADPAGHRASARSSACCPAPGRRSRRSRPTCSRRSSPRTRRGSAAAPSRAWPGPRPPTTPTRSASSSRCSRSGFPASGVMALMLGALTIHGIAPGPAGDDAEARPLLGAHRQHVDRQPDAGGAQPAADRPLGEPAPGALPPALPRHHGVLGHRHLQREQQRVRDLPDGDLRRHRLRLAEARAAARRRCCSGSCWGR